MVERLGGIILAGGRSTRMGADKATLDWGGVPLVVHVAGILRSVAEGPVVVVSSPGQELPPLPAGVEVAVDAVSGQGPLEGLHAGLVALEGRVGAAFVTGVDAALLTSQVVAGLAAALGSSEIVAPVLDGRVRPLPGVYRVALASRVGGLLEIGVRALHSVLDGTDVVALDDARLRALDPSLASFTRINTPAELEAARARAS